MNCEIMEIIESLKENLIFYGIDLKSILKEVFSENNNLQEEIEFEKLQSIMKEIPNLVPPDSFSYLKDYICSKHILNTSSSKTKAEMFILAIVKLLGNYNPLLKAKNYWLQLGEFLISNQKRAKVDLLNAFKGNRVKELHSFYKKLCEACSPELVFTQKYVSKAQFCSILDSIKLPVEAKIGCTIFLLSKRNVKEIDLKFLIDGIKKYNFKKNVSSKLDFHLLWKLRLFFIFNDCNLNQISTLLHNMIIKGEESREGNSQTEEVIKLEFFFDLFKFKFNIDLSFEEIKKLQLISGNDKGIKIHSFVQLTNEIYNNFQTKKGYSSYS